MSIYYQDDLVTLYHGDCREHTQWLDADVLVTDPPYGFGASLWTENDPCIAGEPRQHRNSDRVIGPEAVALRDAALGMWGQVRASIIFGNWRAPRPEGTRMRLIWDRQHIGMGGIGPWHPTDEEMYAVGSQWVTAPRGSESTVIRVPRLHTRGRDHPHAKPVGLMERVIGWTPPGVIADPFAGSGSTLVAARNLGRSAIGVEMEEKYCEIIAKRLDQYVLDFGGVS